MKLTHFALILFSVATVDRAAESPWLIPAADRRIPIRVAAGGTPRFNKAIEVTIDFGKDQSPNLRSLRLIEIDNAGGVLDDAVPVQFDPAEPQARGDKRFTSGTLTFILQGKTASDATRRYHLYFSGDPKGPFTAPAVPSFVSVSETKILDDMPCFKIQTLNATYIYGKDGAGFASIIDRDGRDWIIYSHSPKAAGDYHGLPKFGHPEKLFHAGYKGFKSTITQQGPLKVQIYSEHTDGKSACTWNFFPTCAAITLHKFKLPTFWFLYEGMPGGRLDVNNDYVIRANGRKTTLAEPWTDNVPWVYFVSGPHALFLASHQKHDKVDSYVAWPFQPEADGAYQQMTVFGFGRKGYKELTQHIADLKDLPATYTIGFTDQIDFDKAKVVIESAYRSMQASVDETEIAPPWPALP
jgi:hypothetical protein